MYLPMCVCLYLQMHDNGYKFTMPFRSNIKVSSGDSLFYVIIYFGPAVSTFCVLLTVLIYHSMLWGVIFILSIQLASQ